MAAEVVERLEGWREQAVVERLRDGKDRAASLVFGDELGTLIFMGALLFFALYWRIGIFITDNWTIANTLVAVADGHLYLDEFVYGPPDVVTPGMHFVDGRVYGRNYGQVFLALPFLWVVEAVMFVADLKVAIAGAWSLLLVGFVSRVGAMVGDRERFVWLGVGGALVAFVVNVVYAVPFEPRMRYLVALQLSTMVVSALIGVVLYRLVSSVYQSRTGVFVGAATVMATPIGFWASLPKRHILIALLAIVTIAAFYASRAVESDDVALWYRGLAYAAVGLAAWVHAAEALTLFLVIVPIDLATARSNSPRRLAFVSGMFFVSLLPFIVTNQLIAGNPLIPPRFIERAPAPPAMSTVTPTPEPTTTVTPHGAGTPATPSGGTETPSAAVGETTPGDGGFSLAPLVGVVDAVIQRTQRFLTVTTAYAVAAVEHWHGYVSRGVEEVSVEPAQVYHAYVQSEHMASRATPTDLALLETTPVFGILVALPLVALARIQSLGLSLSSLSSPVRQTDLLAVAYVLALAAFNLERLPLHAMWTARFLVSLIPVGMYVVGRLGVVRWVIADQRRLLAYTTAALVLVGGQLLVVTLVVLGPTRGEVMQLHGALGLVAAAVVAVWTLLAVVGRSVEAVGDTVLTDSRVGAVLLAVPLAVGTLFVLLTGLEYFVTGHFGLGFVELVSEAIPLF